MSKQALVVITIFVLDTRIIAAFLLEFSVVRFIVFRVSFNHDDIRPCHRFGLQSRRNFAFNAIQNMIKKRLRSAMEFVTKDCPTSERGVSASGVIVIGRLQSTDLTSSAFFFDVPEME